MGKYFLAHLSSVLQYVQARLSVRSNWMSCRYWSQLSLVFHFPGSSIYIFFIYVYFNRILLSIYLVGTLFFPLRFKVLQQIETFLIFFLIIMLISSMKKNIQNAFFFNGPYVHKFKPKRFFGEISLF